MIDDKRLRVLVVGGLGGVGEGIVRAFLGRRNRLERLLVSSRDGDRLARFHASSNDRDLILPIVGSVASSSAANRLREAVLAHGPLDVVIASLGGWWAGSPLIDVDDDAWRANMDTLLTTHFVCARAFVPVLEESKGKYLLIGGGAARTPVPGSSLVSIAGAAQVMLTRALVAERCDSPFPLITELLVEGAVKTSARHHGPMRDGEITALEVGEAAAKWALESNVETDPSFDWPAPLLTHDGPITIMHPRP